MVPMGIAYASEFHLLFRVFWNGWLFLAFCGKEKTLRGQPQPMHVVYIGGASTDATTHRG